MGGKKCDYGIATMYDSRKSFLRVLSGAEVTSTRVARIVYTLAYTKEIRRRNGTGRSARRWSRIKYAENRRAGDRALV